MAQVDHRKRDEEGPSREEQVRDLSTIDLIRMAQEKVAHAPDQPTPDAG